LATAYHLNKELDKAYITLNGALHEQWPEDWGKLSDPQREFLARIGWNEGPFLLYRKCDTYYAKLLYLRRREMIRKEQPEAVDAIFDGGEKPSPIRFVDEKGEFAAGKLARAESAKLPRDALAIVQQLVV